MSLSGLSGLSALFGLEVVDDLALNDIEEEQDEEVSVDDESQDTTIV